MKDSRSLATKCILLFIFLILMNIASIIVQIAYLKSNYWVLMLLVGSLIGSLIYGYYDIVKSYRRLQKNIKMFNAGNTYESLFRSRDLFCQEMKPMFRRIEELLDKRTAIQMSKKQAQYLALQNQINPHFLYNTLEAIRGDALDMGMDSIAKTTEALATFFRYTITEVENLVTLEDELQNAENYYIIQKYRFGEKINMEVVIKEEDSCVMQAQLPKLTLQPIIENAIYHGLECKRGMGTIAIRVEMTESKLLISITDDGVGIAAEKLDCINERLSHVQANYHQGRKAKKGGIALINVSERIKLLFGEVYGIHVYSTLNLGTDVRIMLPLIMDGKNEKRTF